MPKVKKCHPYYSMPMHKDNYEGNEFQKVLLRENADYHQISSPLRKGKAECLSYKIAIALASVAQLDHHLITTRLQV